MQRAKGAHRSNAPSPPSTAGSSEGNVSGSEDSSSRASSCLVTDARTLNRLNLGQSHDPVAYESRHGNVAWNADGCEHSPESWVKRSRHIGVGVGVGFSSQTVGTLDAPDRTEKSAAGCTHTTECPEEPTFAAPGRVQPRAVPLASVDADVQRSVSVGDHTDAAGSQPQHRQVVERAAAAPQQGPAGTAVDRTCEGNTFGAENGKDSMDSSGSGSRYATRMRFQSIPVSGNLRYLSAGRAGHAMASVDNRVYIFGGHRSATGTPDPDTLPPPGLYRVTTDGQKRYTVHFCDLIELDGETRLWRLMSNAADEQPAPRRHATMVSFDGSLYVYGGFDAENHVLGDLWRFDLHSERRWALVSCQGRARASGALLENVGHAEHRATETASDAALGAATSISLARVPTAAAATTTTGTSNVRGSEVRFRAVERGQSRSERRESFRAPHPSIGAGLSATPEHATSVQMIPLPEGGPTSGRAEHSAVTYGHLMIVFGGYDGRRKVNTTAVCDLRSGKWFCPRALQETMATGRPGIDYPHRRCKHSAVVYDDMMYVFGGFQYRNKLNYGCSDLFVLNLCTWSWHCPVLMHGGGPQAVHGHCAVAGAGAMYVFGGKVRLDATQRAAQPVLAERPEHSLPPHALTSAVSADTSPTPSELRSSDLSRDIWKYHFHLNMWQRIALDELTEASLGQASAERVRVELHPRQLASAAVVAPRDPLRCSMYLFGGTNRAKDRFFGDMYVFYGLGTDRGDVLQPCRFCTELGKALHEPTFADVIFEVPESLDALPEEDQPAGPAVATAHTASPVDARCDRIDASNACVQGATSARTRHVSAAMNAGQCATGFPREATQQRQRQQQQRASRCRLFYAHRVILAARSEYFADMFHSGLRESLHGEWPRVIHLPDVSAPVFEAVLRYLYTGELPVHDARIAARASGRACHDNAMDASAMLSVASTSERDGRFLLECLRTADMLRLDELRNFCVALVERAIRPENVAFVLEIAAQREDGMGGLKAYCLAYITHHFAEVIETAAFQDLLRRDPAGLGKHVLQAYHESMTGTDAQRRPHSR